MNIQLHLVCLCLHSCSKQHSREHAALIWIDAVLIWFIQVSLGFSVRMLQSLLSLKLMLLAVSHKGQPVLKEPLMYLSRICRLQSPFLQRIHGIERERAGVLTRPRVLVRYT